MTIGTIYGPWPALASAGPSTMLSVLSAPPRAGLPSHVVAFHIRRRRPSKLGVHGLRRTGAGMARSLALSMGPG
jgi:hypothetical protein